MRKKDRKRENIVCRLFLRCINVHKRWIEKSKMKKAKNWQELWIELYRYSIDRLTARTFCNINRIGSSFLSLIFFCCYYFITVRYIRFMYGYSSTAVQCTMLLIRLYVFHTNFCNNKKKTLNFFIRFYIYEYIYETYCCCYTNVDVNFM